MIKKVIIRVDGNATIGLGHIYRGIALAEMLKDEFDVSFLTRRSSTVSPITDAEFNVEYIPESIELKDEPEYFVTTLTPDTIIVLDGYEFTEEYQQKIKNNNYKLVYIDDLAQGVQKADLVINHSPGVKESDYKKEAYTKLALGLDYALLRKSFINYKRSNTEKIKKIKSVFVSFGGADPNDFSYKTVNSLLKIDLIENINVLVGAAYKHNLIFNINNSKINIYRDISEKKVFNLMKSSDLAIVPASTTSIELAFLNIPMLLGYFVENQKGIYRGFIEENEAIPLGNFSEFNFNNIENNIDYYLTKVKELKSISNSNPKENIIKLICEINEKTH